MATSFELPINRFFHRIEEDRDFFQYYNLNDTAAFQLAQQRALSYLHNAIDKMMLEGMPDIDFSDIDEPAAQFNVDLTSREVFILASLMYEFYLEKDIAKLKTYNVNYTSTDMKVFDPSNARSTFQSLYDGVVAKNELLLDQYRNTDRLTGAFKTIDYSSYDDGEDS